jgi:hypothetical protein
MSGTFPGKTHNNLNNCVRKMRAPDARFAVAGFQERYVYHRTRANLRCSTKG